MENKTPKRSGDPLTAARLSWLQACGLDQKVSALEMRLAVLLALQYAGQPASRKKFEESGVPVAWPSQVGLAEKLQCSRQAIAAAARRLKKRGLLQIVPGLGRGHATEYALQIKGKPRGGLLRRPYTQHPNSKKAIRRIKKGNESQEKANELVAPFHSIQSRNHIHSHSKGNGSGNYSGDEMSLPEFEQVFMMWPNPNKDYGKAKGAWINKVVKPGVDPEKVLSRAKRWCDFWESEGTQLIPYLGKWLAERGWSRKPPKTEAEREEHLKKLFGLDEEEATPSIHYTYDPDSPD